MNAAGVVLAHNHPSGDPTPSPEDCLVTKRLIEAGNILGVEVMDHVILGERGAFFSLRRDGKAWVDASQNDYRGHCSSDT